MSKKILSVMLALVMVLSVFSISAFAAVSSSYEKIDEEAGETQIAYTQKWSLVTTNEPDADGYYTVDVVLETNYNTGIISFDIVADGAKLVDAVAGSAITYTADVAFFEGMEHIDIIPNPTPAQAAVNAPVFAAGSVIATLTYALDDGASTATLKLMNDSKCEDNQGGTLFAVRLDNKTLASNSVHYGQRVIDAAGTDIAIGAEIASVTIGQEAAEPNTLVIVDSQIKFSDAYCYNAHNGILCGFANNVTASITAANLTTNKLTTTLGDEYLNVVANENGKYSTGAVIQVLDTDKTTVLESYVVVIFGDVDCNGTVTTDDAKVIASKWRQYTRDAQSPLKVAANTNGDASMAISTDDAKDVAARWRALARSNGQTALASSLFN